MDERRRYFRIDDEVLLAWRVLDEHEIGRFRQGALRARIRRESVQELVFHLDTRLDALGEKLRAVDPAVREAIEILNRKLALIERLAMQGDETSAEDETAHELTKANLSACGLAVHASAPAPIGACVAVDLILLPEYQQLELVGEVKTCRDGHEPQPYRIAIEFLDLREEDRDRLARHVVRKQTERLRDERALR